MESFVDVTYHGIEVARRVKLTEVAPDSGYLEVAAPMPVGTTLLLTIEGGVEIPATVRGVHEQIGGSDRAPGMRVKPTLAGEIATRWWAERVTLIAEGAPTSRRTHEMTAVEDATARAVGDRARADSGVPPLERRDTREMQPSEVRAAVLAAAAEAERLGVPKKPIVPEAGSPADGVPAAMADDDGLVDDGKRTEVMSAVDPEILARLTGSGDMPLIDDGKRTTIMDIPPVMDEDGNGNGDDSDDGDDNGSTSGEQPLSPSASGSMPARGKKRRKKRR